MLFAKEEGASQVEGHCSPWTTQTTMMSQGCSQVPSRTLRPELADRQDPMLPSRRGQVSAWLVLCCAVHAQMSNAANANRQAG